MVVWFDPITDTVTKRMKVGPRPNQLACTPDGKLAYVPCDDASWWVIDTAGAKVLKKIATGPESESTEGPQVDRTRGPSSPAAGDEMPAASSGRSS